MTWWQWALAVLVLTAGLAFGAFRLGVTTQRRDDADARLRLAVALDSVRQAHAADTARLNREVARGTLAATVAEARAKAAESTAQRATDDVLAAQEALKASLTTFAEARTEADSLAAYPPMVRAMSATNDALTREKNAMRDSRDEYKAALAASKEKSGSLLARIATDSVLIERQRDALGKVIPPPPSKSGWGCVAGVGAVTGVRTGVGVGVTCGRRL